MLKAFPFGDWLPDLPGGVSSVSNLLPIANGYMPVKGFSAITAALPSATKGIAAFVSSIGTTCLLAGTITDLYKYAAGAWTSVLSGASAARWRFTQFGDHVICANGAQLASFDINAGTAVAISGAPTATEVATVRDFVMAGGADGSATEVRWSQFDDSSSWTAGVNQADTQPLPDGGKIMAIVGGEYGIILQKGAIRRATYVGEAGGLDIVFQFDVISSEIGCMAQGSVANVGRLIFFLAERGFQMCDGENVVPIADEKFNRWFFSTYSRSDIDNMVSAIDPRNSLVMWGMPANPGRIIVYNWVLKRGAVVQTDVQWVASGFTANTSIDDLGDIDAISGSLDDPIYSGGNPFLMVANSSNVIGMLAGPNLAASIMLQNVEPTPGRRSRIRSLRAITDATTASVSVNSKLQAGDGPGEVSTSEMRLNGKMPLRANGRYNDIMLSIPAGAVWTYLQGIEVEFEAGDGR